MPRPVRNILTNHFYHIVARGNNRQTLFHEQVDFRIYLQKLVEAKEKHPISIFHYCLMTNHIHLLLRSSSEAQSISRFIHLLQTSYARYFQKKNKISGHVFENRFRHFWIKTDAYLLECGRYIERNPVRANLAQHPQDYPWSSYHHYGTGSKNPILKTNPLYLEFGKSDKQRQTLYARYVDTPRPYEEILDETLEKKWGANLAPQGRS